MRLLVRGLIRLLLPPIDKANQPADLLRAVDLVDAIFSEWVVAALANRVVDAVEISAPMEQLDHSDSPSEWYVTVFVLSGKCAA